MIDLNVEEPITLTEATKSKMLLVNGRRRHLSRLYDWSVHGLRGVILETVQIGGTRCTSREALIRFFERLSTPRSSDAARRTSMQRQRAMKLANDELEQDGIG